MYSAIVVDKSSLVIESLRQFDRLYLVHVDGRQFLCGKESIDNNEKFIYFPPDGIICEEVCANNKLRKKDGGYLEDSGKVRGIKMKGVVSMGLLLPLQFVTSDITKYKNGQELTEIDGKPLCWRAPIVSEVSTNRDQRSKKGGSLPEDRYNHLVSRFSLYKFPKINNLLRTIYVGIREFFAKPELQMYWNLIRISNGYKTNCPITDVNFPEHIDTPNFNRVIGLFNGSTIYVRRLKSFILTEKLHGTSARYANIRGKDNRIYTLVGSRRQSWRLLPFDNEKLHPSQYREYWGRYVGDRLTVGQVVYGEIVGYVGGSCIQKMGTEHFSYGTTPETHPYGQFYVYKLVKNGEVQDFEDTCAWCSDNDLEMVPITWSYYDDNYMDPKSAEELYDILVNKYNKGDNRSSLDNKHMMEGVCIHTTDNKLVAKFKTLQFMGREVTTTEEQELQ